MNTSRRQFFKSALGTFAFIATASVLPKRVWAAWSDKAFVSETL